jgi:peptidoglycan-associated lipoprotein
MKNAVRFLPAILGAALLAACGSPAPRPVAEAVVEDRSPEMLGLTEEEMQAAATAGLTGEEALALRALDDPANPLFNRVVYFEFDSSEVNAQDRETVAIHAQFLASHPTIVVNLEGHTDERGTREYNIGLGERRAQAVRRLLTLQGASQEQIRTVSYGEERPAAFGNDESSWRLNRRVEFVYPGR